MASRPRPPEINWRRSWWFSGLVGSSAGGGAAFALGFWLGGLVFAAATAVLIAGAWRAPP